MALEIHRGLYDPFLYKEELKKIIEADMMLDFNISEIGEIHGQYIVL